MNYSIKVYKEYFNFSSSHFLIFPNGEREPLHGHNYRVKIQGHALELESDMVFDFLDIKPVVKEICDSIDHRLLLPGENPQLRIESQGDQYKIMPPDGTSMTIPRQDVLVLPIRNTSAERLAVFLAQEIRHTVHKRFQFSFKELEVEVEETPGQSAVYTLKEEDL